MCFITDLWLLNPDYSKTSETCVMNNTFARLSLKDYKLNSDIRCKRDEVGKK